MSTASSWGGGEIRSSGILHPTSLALVDVSAPGSMDQFYWLDSALQPTYSTIPPYEGFTSYASPVVAGNAALAMSTLRNSGYASMVSDARLMQTFLIMQADGWAAGPGTKPAVALDPQSGAGRFKNFVMSTLTSPKGWACHKATLSTVGQVATYSVGFTQAQSAQVKTWKAVLTWDEQDLDNAADLDLSVHNACASGSPMIRQDAGYDVRERIRLETADVSGKCLEYRVLAFRVPSPRTFTVCDYYQAGNTTSH